MILLECVDYVVGCPRSRSQAPSSAPGWSDPYSHRHRRGPWKLHGTRGETDFVSLELIALILAFEHAIWLSSLVEILYIDHSDVFQLFCQAWPQISHLSFTI